MRKVQVGMVEKRNAEDVAVEKAEVEDDFQTLQIIPMVVVEKRIQEEEEEVVDVEEVVENLVDVDARIIIHAITLLVVVVEEARRRRRRRMVTSTHWYNLRMVVV